MAKPDAIFIYIGTYPSEAAAPSRLRRRQGSACGGCGGAAPMSASVVTKDDAGKVHVNKDEMAARHGAWGGAAVGALIGILFPPAIIGTALVGAAVGGVGGHCGVACPAPTSKSSGDTMGAGEAALVIVGESKLQQAVDKAGLKAEKHVAKEISSTAKDVDRAVQEVPRSPLTARARA